MHIYIYTFIFMQEGSKKVAYKNLSIEKLNYKGLEKDD